MKKRGVAAVFAEDDDDEEESFAREQEEERRKEMLATRKRAEKRNLDIFMEELKSSSSSTTTAATANTRESMKFKQLRMDSSSGKDKSIDNVALLQEEEQEEDIEWERSTNIHISNIPMGINESDLCNEFGVFGPIASVKIMWPRGMDSSALSLSGFVSFMVRGDAARAIAEMDGKRIAPATSTLELKVGWGKPLQKLPQVPFFIHPARKNVSLPGGTLDNNNNSAGGGGMIRIEIPVSIEERRLIHRLVERVLVHGPAFEAAIMARERENPNFEFLSNPNCPSHLYYRWRIYSLLQGDGIKTWSTDPFRIFENGLLLLPPPMSDDLYSQDSDEDDEEEAGENNNNAFALNEEDEAFLFPPSDDKLEPDARFSRRNGAKVLSSRNRFILENMIRDLSIGKSRIGEAMFFCLRHGYAHEEIVPLLKRSILECKMPFPVLMARVYLLSDILYNSGVSVANGWKFRIGQVFDHLQKVIECDSISQDDTKVSLYRSVVKRLLDTWESCAIFPPTFLSSLRHEDEDEKEEEVVRLDKDLSAEEGKGNAAENQTVKETKDLDEIDEDLDGTPLNEDLDGIPFNEDLDGIPLRNASHEDELIDEDLDGVPLVLASAVNNDDEFVDEDLDGIPLILPPK